MVIHELFVLVIPINCSNSKGKLTKLLMISKQIACKVNIGFWEAVQVQIRP